MTRLGIAALALTLGFAGAPSAKAQSNGAAVCNDGTSASNAGLRTCANHGGLTQTATRGSQTGTYGTRGANGATARVQCPDGTSSASGIHGCGTIQPRGDGRYTTARRSANGDVVSSTRSYDSRTSNGNNGKHKGQKKHAKAKKHDRDHDHDHER